VTCEDPSLDWKQPTFIILVSFKSSSGPTRIPKTKQTLL